MSGHSLPHCLQTVIVVAVLDMTTIVSGNPTSNHNANDKVWDGGSSKDAIEPIFCPEYQSYHRYHL